MVNLELEIPLSFFEEEVRNGFLVTKERKQLWGVELDLLCQLDKVCKAYGLPYCVGAGTMLGAVRHQGFIPWDDDIDVYMLRKDYNQLIKHADAFAPPYFLQCSDTEKDLCRTFARLRNSQTTGATHRETGWGINKGIFIDIFPLDGISPDEKKDRQQQRRHKLYVQQMNWYNVVHKTGYHPRGRYKLALLVKKMLVSVMIHNKADLAERLEGNLSRYSVEGTEVWGNRTLVFSCPKSRRPLKDYTDLVRMPFEMIDVPVPRNYDEMLRQQYGDYMKIPENKAGTVHGELIVSTDRPYSDPEMMRRTGVL